MAAKPPNKKRRIVGEHKKWTSLETTKILEYMKDTIINGQEIEKPTAAVYYGKMIEHLQFNDVTASKLQNKIRNLKKDYEKAKHWKNQTGQGVLAEQGEETVKDYVLKLCQHFDALDEVYGSKVNINPPAVFETGSDRNEELWDGKESYAGGEVDDEIVEIGEIDGDQLNFTQPSRTNDESEILEAKTSLLKLPKSWAKAMKPDTLSSLTEVQSQRVKVMEKKIQLEEDKFNLDKDFRSRSLDFEREKFQHERILREEELRLKNCQIDSSERLRMLELEKEERIEKYKIDQELKLKLELAKLSNRDF